MPSGRTCARWLRLRSAAAELRAPQSTCGRATALLNARASMRDAAPITTRRSKVQGRGVFATRAFAEGERIVEYTGERISSDQADAQCPDDEGAKRHHTFLFAVDDHVVIDGSNRGKRRPLHQPLVRPELRGRHRPRARLHPRAARHRRGRGALLRLLVRHRRELHARRPAADLPLPLRLAEVPGHPGPAPSADEEARRGDLSGALRLPREPPVT